MSAEQTCRAARVLVLYMQRETRAVGQPRNASWWLDAERSAQRESLSQSGSITRLGDARFHVAPNDEHDAVIVGPNFKMSLHYLAPRLSLTHEQGLTHVR